jgi:hypothetical protein
MTTEEKLTELIKDVLNPLIGDLCQNEALKEWQRDELWARLEELTKEGN